LHSDEAQNVIDAVFHQVGIVRVVSVDDNYEPLPKVEEIIGKSASIEASDLQRLLTDFPGLYSAEPDVFSKRLRSFWNQESASAKEKLCAVLNVGSTTGPAEESADLAAVRNLPRFFHNYEFEALGLPEWRDRSDALLTESESHPTLVMFDEDLSKHGGSSDEGLTLIKEALAKVPEGPLICCLFSHKYHEETLDDSWKKLCEDHGFPLNRVVVIPKELLKDKPEEFAAFIKLSAVSKHYADLRGGAQALFAACVKAADEKIGLLNIRDLDKIVFASSTREGVWEPDTLIRLLAIYHRTEMRKKSLTDDALRNAAAIIRKISAIDTGSSGKSTAAIWKIHHLENYEESDLLNELHRPTDLADIYEKTGGRRFILIAPQCDLMVRTLAGYRGNDADSVKDGVLAQIVDRKPAYGWKLDFYSQNGDVWVDFKKTFSTRLMHLDLCVFNVSGEAELSLGSSPASLLIPAWEKRHRVAIKYLEELIAVYERIAPSGTQKNDVNRMLTRSNNEAVFDGLIDPERRALRLNFKRVARLLPPRSTALVKAYSEFLNRDAFEHSFLDG
jgi:hypothetical protein